MARARDASTLLLIILALVGVLVVVRDLRYDFTFANDMRQAELARRTQSVTTTITSTELLTQTAMVTEVVQVPQEVAATEKANAAFVILTRNGDLNDLRETLVQLEDRFNRRHHYPYVFLNNEEFSDEFKQKIASVVSGECQFGLIPKEHWSYPEYINQTRAAEVRKDMAARGVIYGGHENYRHMCRYESGFFFRHPLMDQYK
ncbi:alpha 1,2-mannosyltransferase 2.4.1, partial [Coemansia thaxteri]